MYPGFFVAVYRRQDESNVGALSENGVYYGPIFYGFTANQALGLLLRYRWRQDLYYNRMVHGFVAARSSQDDKGN